MLDIVLLIFGIIALGFLARQARLIPENAYLAINDYVYYISMPALIFSKLAQVHLGPGELLLLAANTVPIAAMMVAVCALWKLRLVSNKLAAALLLTAFFGNIVYMGFPIIEMKFGSDALATAAIISFVYNFMIFSFGMLILSAMAGRKGGAFARKKLLGNTIIISCLAGALFSLSGIALPGLLLQLFSTVGATTAPLALFSLGLFLHGQRLAKSPFALGLLCAFKLILFPAIFLSCALLLGFRGQPFQISLIEAFMPVAVTNFVIAQKFGLDSELVAESILASTLLSLPLLLGFDWLVGVLPA